MGYTTDFKGKFELNKPADEKLKTYLKNFSESRRMKRDNDKIKEIFPNWADYTLDGNLGYNGEFFAYTDDNFGQTEDASIINYNCPPATQPGLWCQWTISDDGNYIEWDGGEKFYSYIDWLDYIITNFLAPHGYTLTGIVKWQGEDRHDFGKIIVIDNEIEIREY